jgi:hypothetical protein
MTDIGQWTTAEPLFTSYASWLGDAEEQKRIAAYALYEAIYWQVPNTFKLLARGSETNPIYLPAPKTIVNTINRYTAPKMTMLPDPFIGTDSDRTNASAIMKAFLTREKFYSKFGANKLEGIFRGDWAWHIYASPEREDGARISIQPIDPGSMFPIYNEENLDEVIGWHIVDQYDYEGKPAIRRLTYRKATGVGGPSPITVSDIIFEADKWGGPGMSEDDAVVLAVIAAEETMPDPIDHLPIYAMPNIQTTGTIWGSSELRGTERILAAMNQTISDEELALALEGLGVYKTNAGTPVNDDGDEVPWNIGPGRVVELPTDTDGDKVFFDRVQGISSIEPNLAHIKFLMDQVYESSAVPGVARGSVDVQMAESGIALYLHLAPLLTTAEDKELIITETHAQMFYDLRKWFAAYEPGELATPLMNTAFGPAYGEKIPVNRKERFTEIMGLWEADLVTAEWTWTELAKIGYEFPEAGAFNMAIMEEQTARKLIEDDVAGARLDAELGE